MNYSKRIDRGIRLLDAEVGPGWEDTISLVWLDMAYKQECVLGQIYGSYDQGRKQLGLGGVGSCRHGFEAYHRRGFPELTAQWKDAIRSLRSAREGQRSEVAVLTAS